MNEFLSSLKADLLDRRLLPIVALVCALLVAAIAYAVLGGSSGTPAPSPLPSAGASALPPGIAVTGATAERAVAETTDGVREQRSGKARNPFAPIAGAATSTTSSSSSGSGAGSSSGSSGSEAGGEKSSETKTEPAKTEETKKSGSKKKSHTVYHVAIEFGEFPAGATPETVVLTPYENLKLQTALPSSTQPLVVYRGVTKGGKSATFSIVGEAILHGIGNCLPSATQCQALDLKPGQSETLEYLPPSGPTVVYELRVVTIAAAKAKGASAGLGESKAGAEILRRAGLTELPILRYSSEPGVLVFPEHHAHAARAHASLWHRRISG